MDFETLSTVTEMNEDEKKLYWREYHRVYSKARYNKNPIVRMKKKLAYYKRTYADDNEIQNIISSDRDIMNKIIDLSNTISLRKFKN